MTLRRVLNAVGGLLFAVAVVVQYNDPDPLVWMGIYGAALAVCALDVLGKNVRRPARIVAGVALLWAVSWAPRIVRDVPWSHLFDHFSMKDDVHIEEAREFLGLLIVALWTGVLAFTAKRS
jgi:hypothetical protein